MLHFSIPLDTSPRQRRSMRFLHVLLGMRATDTHKMLPSSYQSECQTKHLISGNSSMRAIDTDLKQNPGGGGELGWQDTFALIKIFGQI